MKKIVFILLAVFVIFITKQSLSIEKGKWSFVKDEDWCYIGSSPIKSDLPENESDRDQLLLQIMGSPDERQINGLGGANPLTSKVAIVSKSILPNVDIDYLFAQVVVDQPVVGYGQNCGNILAGVGQFAIEKGLVLAEDFETDVVIHMVNSGDNAIATIQTPGGIVNYNGHAEIDGVPGKAAPVRLNFLNTAGSLCGSLLPTGNIIDIIDGFVCFHIQ